jgi:hypothetical protein
VNLIEIDGVGAQPAERIVDLLEDAGAAAVAKWLLVLPIEPDLGGENHTGAAAALGQSLADNLFGSAETVGRRRIDQSNAAVERRVDRADRFGLVSAAPHPAADRPGAKPDARRSKLRTGNTERFHVRCVGHGDSPKLAGPRSREPR